MKKTILALLTASVMLLSACSGTPVISPVPGPVLPDQSTEQPGPALPADGEAVRTGLAITSGVGSSKDAAAGEPGLAQSDITLAAVLVDDDGVITDCVIDGIQAKINFGADGVLITDADTRFPTKNELGTDYGMGKYSGIGREWDQQMAALADYAVGKTAEELAGIAVNENGAPADADLAASVTIYVGGIVDTVVQAAQNARHMGAAQGDRLALAAVTDMGSSADVTAEKDGLAQAGATVAAVTFRDGVISGCVIDGVQCNVNFDAAGRITSDLTTPIRTKNELGIDYGMGKYSGIGKEWNEQAAAFAQYVTGKTAEEVMGIAVNEKGAPAGADLTASVTMGVGALQQVIEKAAG